MDLIATSPSCQGHGYGSAVLRKITGMVNFSWSHRCERLDHLLTYGPCRQTNKEELLAAWLVSSNFVNTAFYNSHGFVTIEAYRSGSERACSASKHCIYYGPFRGAYHVNFCPLHRWCRSLSHHSGRCEESLARKDLTIPGPQASPVMLISSRTYNTCVAV